MSIKWEHDAAKKELAFLTSLFGQPTAVAPQKGGMALWNTATLQKTKLFGLPNCLDEYELRDEEIYRKFPVKHYENQYASIVVDVEPQVLEYVVNLSGSVQYDPLKKLLTARGGDLASTIGTLYLALRIVENPARLRAMQKNKMYGRLIQSMHKLGGVRGMNMAQAERVYKGLCRLKRDLPQVPIKGYWRGAFSSEGGAPMVDGKYAGNARNAVHSDMISRKKAAAATRVANLSQKLQERRRQAREKEAEGVEDLLEETIWAGNSQNTLRKYNRGNAAELRELRDGNITSNSSNSRAYNAPLPANAGSKSGLYYPADDFKKKYGLADDVVFQVNPEELNLPGEQIADILDKTYDLEDGALQNSVPNRDIDLDLQQQYARDNNRQVEISSIEPMQGRFSRDIDLDLSQLYQTSHNRPVRVTGIEPMQSNNTNHWAQQLAAAEGQNVANSGGAGTHNRNNAREYFCGRRQYNPDIPPCRAHEDHPQNRGCDPCDNYVKVYHTGLRPAETTDPTCYYGRRHDPYVDTAAYMRHYEDNAHDPGFYNNFY